LLTFTRFIGVGVFMECGCEFSRNPRSEIGKSCSAASRSDLGVKH
jgi:hypothetical protein